jgi:hypothetical protein
MVAWSLLGVVFFAKLTCPKLLSQLYCKANPAKPGGQAGIVKKVLKRRY